MATELQTEKACLYGKCENKGVSRKVEKMSAKGVELRKERKQ